jgi:hypothetical protein
MVVCPDLGAALDGAGMRLSPEELAQAMSGPSHFVLQWIQSVGRNQVETVWPQMTPDFRLAMTQGWLTRNPAALSAPSAVGLDRDQLASILSVENPEHDLFTHLARVSMRDIRNAYGDLDVDQMGPGLRPRPIGANLELVRVFYLPDLGRDQQGNYVFAAGATARAATVLVERHGPDWAVAGVGEGLLRPGWPPAYERIVQAGD